MKNKFNITSILLIVILLFLIFNKFVPSEIEKTVISIDTTYHKKIDSLISDYSKLLKFKPDTVYVRIYNNTIERFTEKEIINLTEEEKKEIKTLKEYKDTLENKDVKIFSTILTDGMIYDNKIEYELNIPTIKESIEKTIIKKQNGIYFISEIGFKEYEFQNINIGVQYINKKDWLFSYKAEFIDLKTSPIHTIGVGKKVF